jgi:cytochrome c oxidase subunit IV
MTLSGENMGWFFINLVFLISVISSIVIYIRTPERTRNGLIGVLLIIVITGLYIIFTIFFRSSPLNIQYVLTTPPIVLTGAIYYLVIKPQRSPSTIIFATIILVGILISYAVLLFGS